MTIWPGWGSAGTERCAASPSISTSIAGRSTGWRRSECYTRASAPGARSRPRSRGPAARRRARPGPPYPGVCRRLDPAERGEKLGAGLDFALRLDLAHALAIAGPLDWVEEGGGEHRVRADPAGLGDVVLARKKIPASYHLAVTVDDAIQGVTLVTRGEDLAPATHIHRLLQALLGLPTPRYRHHPLLTDATGRRLAKRDHALTIRAMRVAGVQPGGNPRSREKPRCGSLDQGAVGGAPGAGGPP